MVMADIVFILDSSGSICDNEIQWNNATRCNNWNLILTFAANIIDSLAEPGSSIRVGVVTFADKGRNEFFLRNYTSMMQVKAAIMSIAYVGGNTNTSGGIWKMHSEQFLEINGDRAGVQNIAFIITDGKSTFDKELTEPAATAAQGDGIIMYSIGVTAAVDVTELEYLSSPPRREDENFFLQTDFNMLDTVMQKLVIRGTCPGTTPASRNLAVDKFPMFFF